MIQVQVEREFTDNISKIREYKFNLVALIGLLVSLLLIVFCYQHFGSYFEENDDPRFVMAMKGFATHLPFDNFMGFFYILTDDLYISLYKHFPNIGWYGLSMFLLLWGALFNIYISLYLSAKHIIVFPLFLLIFIAFYFLIFFQNVYWINFARPTILVTSSFIILLSVLYLNIEIFKNNKWVLIFPVITYSLGHLTRLEAGYLGFVFGLVFSILLIYRQKSLLPFLLKFILPVVFFILIVKVVGVFSEKRNGRNIEYLERTKIMRQLIDYKNVTEFVPKDINERIVYDAVMVEYYFGDDKAITIDFLRKLIKETSLWKSGNNKKFKMEFDVFVSSLGNENFIAAIINLSLFGFTLLWLLVSLKNNYKNFFRFLLFHLFYLAIIFGMCYFLKLPARIFNPLLVMWTIGNLILAMSFIRFNKKKFYFFLSVPFFLILFGIPKFAKANNEFIAYYKKYGEVNRLMVDDINEKFHKTIFIPTSPRSWEMHNATDPINEINFKNGNSYVYLSIDISQAPETKDQLFNMFGTSDHSELFKNISKMNNVVFISDDNYVNFLGAYYHYLYKQDYYFETVFDYQPFFYQYTGLNYYRLKKASQ